MQDWQLSETGDILFYEDHSNNDRLKISFKVSEHKSIRINFTVVNSTPLIPAASNHSFHISFKIDNNKPMYNIISLDNSGSLFQLLRTILTTSITDIKDRENIGSKLELVRHLSLKDLNNQTLAVKYIKEAIYDIAPTAIVAIEPFTNKNGKYTTGFTINIKTDDLSYDYELEV